MCIKYWYYLLTSYTSATVITLHVAIIHQNHSTVEL